jgi:hypothetical protein
MALSHIIDGFAPPASCDKEQVCARLQIDDDSTDHGSTFSDNEASVDNESTVYSESMHLPYEVRHHVAPSAPFAPAPLPSAADRRSELRKMGMQVLGNMAPHMTPGANGRSKKAKGNATTERYKDKQLRVNQQAPDYSRQRMPCEPAASSYMKSQQPYAGAMLQMPLLPGPQVALRTPQMSPLAMLEPMKVTNCASFNIDTKFLASFVDLPLKKRPIFESAPGMTRAYNARNPLKKHVSDCLLQDVESVFQPVFQC